MRFLKFIVVLALGWGTVALGQNNPGNIGPSSYEVQLVPANPDVANLGKYGDIPIDKYNGTANISIPIHTIELDGLQIPIQLTYNTGGIPVNQDASWVGLGWNLSDGIVITREVNDFEDIKDLSYGNNHTGWLFSEDKLLPEHPDYQFKLDADELYELHNEYDAGTPDDLKPDLFSLSIPSGSVKFYLPKIVGAETQLTANVIGDKNYKVLYNISPQTFEVTDPNGFTYFFDQKEYSTSYSSDNSGGAITDDQALDNIGATARLQSLDMISSWKVSRIISPHYDAVNNSTAELIFSYTPGAYLSFPNFSETYNLDVVSTTPPSFSTPSDVSATITAFKVSYLEEISGDFGALRFILGSRSDLFTEQAMGSLRGATWNLANITDNQKKLDAVQLVNPYNQTIKTANLDYSYFNNDDYSTDVNGDRKYIRLKLDSLTLLDKVYTFEYESPDSIPAKNTKSIDFWGFYNGESNSIRLPSFNRFLYNTPATVATNNNVNEKFIRMTGANRKSDATYGKIGTLKKITYPTGGYTEFTYEGNSVVLKRQTYTPTFRTNGDFRSSGLSSSEAYDFRYQQLKLANDPTYSLENYAYVQCAVGTSAISTSGSSFSITESNLCDGETYNIEINATLSCTVGCNQGISPSGRAVWIENMDTGVETTVFSYDSHFNASTTTVNLGPKRLNLPIGNYKFQYANWSVSTPFTVVATANASATVRYDASVDPPEDVYEEFEVGGLRLQKITNRDSNGTFIGSKEFDYNTTIENGSLESSGVLMDDLIFWSTDGSLFEYAPDIAVSSDGKFRISSYNKLRTKNSASGSHIGYGLVTETVVGSNGITNGKFVNKFVNLPNEHVKRNIGLAKYIKGNISCPTGNPNPYAVIEDPGIECYDYDEIPYGEVYILGESPNDYSYINGSIIEETIWDANNTLLQKTVNTYNEFNIGSTPFDRYPIMFRVGSIFLLDKPYMILDKSDLGHRKTKRMIKSVVENYYGNETLTTETAFFYDEPIHYQLTKTISTNSNGEVNTTKAYYPQDLNITLLTDENRFQEIVKSETFVGTEADPEERQIYSQETIFDNSIDFNGLTLPSEIITLKGEEDLTAGSSNNESEQRQIYEKYDEKGNLLQYRTTSGKPISYIWGYNKEYPIAKIENAENVDIPSTLLSSIISASNSDTDRTVDIADGNGNKVYQGNEGALREFMDQLRDNLPSGAMMTSYTYDPLLGVTSTTDPRGYATYYYYDSFNRLEHIKDEQGKLLQEYEYAYRSASYVDPDLPSTYPTVAGTMNGTFSVGYGSSHTYSVTATGGSDDFTYSWYKDGIFLNNGISTNIIFNSGDVTLRVDIYDNITGITSSVTQPVDVVSALGSVILDPNPDFAIIGDMVSFAATGFGPGSGSLSYEWFVNEILQSFSGATGFQTSFGSAGLHTVKLVVTDDTTLDTVQGEVDVQIYAPLNVATLTASADKIITGTSVTFNVPTVTGGSPNKNYQWLVEGTEESTSPSNFTYSLFNTVTTYTVTYRVTDTTLGVSDESSMTVTAYAPLNDPAINGDNVHLTAGDSYHFVSSNIGGGSGSRTYQWYIKQGTGNFVLQSYTGQSNFFPSFGTAGTYTVKLVVTDVNVPTHSKEDTSVVNVHGPISIADSDITTPSPVTVNTSTYFNINPASGGSGDFSYEWDILNDDNGYSYGVGTFSEANRNVSNFLMGYEYVGNNTRIQCRVHDNLTGDYSTVSKTIVVNGDTPLSITPIFSTVLTDLPDYKTYRVTATATGGSGSFTYVWSVDGQVVQSGTSNTYEPVALSCGSDESDTVSVTATDTLTGKTVSNTRIMELTGCDPNGNQ